MAGWEPPGVSLQDYTTPVNRNTYFPQTGTRWVRFWADWAVLEPADGAIDEAKMNKLVLQCQTAFNDGLAVIVTMWRFPLWANGLQNMSAAAEATYQLPDRQSSPSSTGRKDLTFKVPADLSPTSTWARFMRTVCDRVGPWIHRLEICNEPNQQMWPQQTASHTSDPYGPGDINIHCSIAQMFQTAEQIVVGRGGSPFLFGPATSDGDAGLNGSPTATSQGTSSRMTTRWDDFHTSLLGSLGAINFRPRVPFQWTSHNYRDVEWNLAGPNHIAKRVRASLVGKWYGWPVGDAANPLLALTEGGARLEKMASVWGQSTYDTQVAMQSGLLDAAWNRLWGGVEGVGIDMFTWLTFRSDPNYDCGLCKSMTAMSSGPNDLMLRPAYNKWATLPSIR